MNSDSYIQLTKYPEIQNEMPWEVLKGVRRSCRCGISRPLVTTSDSC